MVPSLTETFLAAGVEIVGRTRFCIHPQGSQIPVVGGTKDIQWEKVMALRPDLIIFDKEENPSAFVEPDGALCRSVPYLATHIRDHGSLQAELARLAKDLRNDRLSEFSERVSRLIQRSLSTSPLWNFSDIPGILPSRLGPLRDVKKMEAIKHIVYVIWRDPWMRVATETFISSTLRLLGAGPYLVPGLVNYPEFQLEDFKPEEVYYLFSSEPYPFHRKPPAPSLLLQGAIVDGEVYSWFGIRNIEFLEKYFNEHG
jgi:hypothetical protein